MKRRQKVLMVSACLLIIFGICFMAYPWVGNWLNSLTHSAVIDGYLDSVHSESAEQMQAELRRADEYNQMLYELEGVVNDPFSAQAFADALTDYEDLLNGTSDGMMGYIYIPSISVHLPIYHGTGPYALKNGVGHLLSSSLPVGGKNTHAVLSAHSGLVNAEMFDNLDELKQGDFFSVSILNRTVWYEVKASEVVLPDDVSSLKIQPEKDMCSLVTCTPYGINSHRLLVHGERCEPPAAAQVDLTKEKHKTPQKGSFGSIVLMIVGLLTAALFFISKKFNRHQKDNDIMPMK